jgi:hypothetical protein
VLDEAVSTATTARLHAALRGIDDDGGDWLGRTASITN